MKHSNPHPGTETHHTYSREEGYQPAEYVPQEYPKVVVIAHVERTVDSAEQQERLEKEAWLKEQESLPPATE